LAEVNVGTSALAVVNVENLPLNLVGSLAVVNVEPFH